MKNIFFSIVIPLYNKENYIVDAINSILNQSHSNFEVIVVNDGSTDNSKQRVLAFDDKRIKLINQKNQGVSKSRNRGIKSAKGKYIAFLDADDKWKKNFLSNIVSLINKYPNAAAYGTAYEIEYSDNKTKKIKFKTLPNNWQGIIEDYFKEAVKGREILWTCTTVVSKNIFDEIGLFPIGLNKAEDTFIWTKLALNYNVAYSTESLAIYRKYDEHSLSKNIMDKNDFIFADYAKEFIENNKLDYDKKFYLMEYLYKKYLNTASSYIYIDNRPKAKYFMELAKETKLNKKKYYKLVFLNLLPYSLYIVLRHINELLKNLMKKLS